MSKNVSDATLQSELAVVSQPDIDKPFVNIKDALQRLLPYHLFASPDERINDYSSTLQHVRELSEPARTARKRAKTTQEAVDRLSEDLTFRNTCERCYLESSFIQQERVSVLWYRCLWDGRRWKTT